jgi:hypothetical protein
MSVQQKSLPIFRSHGKKHHVQKLITNLDGFEKDFLSGMIFRSYDKGKFPTTKKLALEL